MAGGAPSWGAASMQEPPGPQGRRRRRHAHLGDAEPGLLPPTGSSPSLASWRSFMPRSASMGSPCGAGQGQSMAGAGEWAGTRSRRQARVSNCKHGGGVVVVLLATWQRLQAW